MENKRSNLTKSAIVGNVGNKGNMEKNNKINPSQINNKNSTSVNNLLKSEIKNFSNNIKNDNENNKKDLINSFSISSLNVKKSNMENGRNEIKAENFTKEKTSEAINQIDINKENSEITTENINEIKSISSEHVIDLLNFNTEEINSLNNINFTNPQNFFNNINMEKETDKKSINNNNNIKIDINMINPQIQNFENFNQNLQNCQNNFSNHSQSQNLSNSVNFQNTQNNQNIQNIQNIKIPEILNYSQSSKLNDRLLMHNNEITFAKNLHLTSSISIGSSSEIPNKTEPRSILEDINIFDKFEEDKLKKSSIISDDYLQPDRFTLENHNLIEEEFYKIYSIYDDKKDLSNLQKTIEGVTLDTDQNNKKIGPISTLDYLIESSFRSDYNRKNSIIENLISLEDTIFRWRKIGGDGNCFYRAVIFAYFEKIIFDRDINLLRFHINDFHKSLQDEIFMKKMKMHGIKTELVLKIFLILQNTLNSKEFSFISEIIIEDSTNSEKVSDSIQTTYDFFLRCFNSCKHFDLGLVMYFRYKLFQFIKKSEKKLYSKNFSVAIGNLLPSEYETESGDFLFEKFYEDFLMKLYKDAEKIVIYLTPFVLNVNLNILAFDFYKNSVEKVKEFSCYETDIEKEKISTMTLLYRSSHYDLIYEEKYFTKNVRFLTLFVNLNENLKVIDSELLREKEKIKNLTIRNIDLISFNNITVDSDKNINSFTTVPSNMNFNENLNIAVKNSEYYDIKKFMQINNQNIENVSVDNFFQVNKNTIKMNDNLNLNSITYYQNRNENFVLNEKENLSKTIVLGKEETSHPSKNQKINDIQIFNINSDSDEKELISISNINKILQQNNNNNNYSNYTFSNFNCDKCKKLVELKPANLSSEKLKIKLCDKCLSQEIKVNITTNYLKYISMTKKVFMEQIEATDILRMFNVVFFDTKLNINNLYYDVHISCKLIGQEFNYILNEEVKSTICIMCEYKLPIDWQNVNSRVFKMPCHCFCCRPSCMLSYFNLLLLNYRWKRNNLICFCGTQYSTNELKLLYYFCLANNFQKLNEKISEIFKEKIKNTCMLCLQNVPINVKNNNYIPNSVNNYSNNPNPNFYVSCELKDSQIEKHLLVDKFFHIICNSCFNGEYFQNFLQFGNQPVTRKVNKKIGLMNISCVNCMICNDSHEMVSYEIKKCNEGYEERCSIY